MILEDLGVRLDSFVRLQEDEVAEARTINDSSLQFRNVLDAHSLGRPYRLSYLLRKIEGLKLDLRARHDVLGFDNRFIRQIRQVSMIDILRDMKHNARLRIPESYLLVGVADEGPAYQAAGMENVYTLPEGHIFGSSCYHKLSSVISTALLRSVCIQKSPTEEPVWLEGSCSISRSPVVHPGDGTQGFARLRNLSDCLKHSSTCPCHREAPRRYGLSFRAHEECGSTSIRWCVNLIIGRSNHLIIH